MESLLQFWHVWGGWTVAALLVAISLGFALRFALPAWRLGRELEVAIAALSRLADQEGAAVPDRIAADLMATPHLSHPWREYAQTLHGVGDLRNPKTVTGWRATAMAEEFFSDRALVDIPLKTEFYKHLPGILTGIGIIGTFTGLIAGLSHFEVSNNTEAVRMGLRTLIQSVGQAFEVSAAAIALAMVVTWTEKSFLARRYRQVEKLVQLIDSLFDTGVGEEYLARLVRASEASAVQAAKLQQAIAGELRQSMEAMLAQQQAAAERQQEALAAKVAEAVAQTLGTTLKEPLARMAAGVEQLGAGQGETLGAALEKALGRFTAHLDESFGRRQDSLESLLKKTASAMEAAVAELGKVASRLDQTGRGAVESAAGQLDAAGRGVGEAATAFAMTSSDMAASASALTEAAKAVGQALRDQRQGSADIAQMVADLRGTVESARREAALTAELVSRMEAAAGAFSRAGQQAETYLQGVSGVLSETHAAFAENIERTLAQGNNQFQNHVAGAVEALKGAIEELADALAQEALPR